MQWGLVGALGVALLAAAMAAHFLRLTRATRRERDRLAEELRQARSVERLLAALPHSILPVDNEGQRAATPLLPDPSGHAARLDRISGAARAEFAQRVQECIQQGVSRPFHVSEEGHSLVAEIVPLQRGSTPPAAVLIRDASLWDDLIGRMEKLAVRNDAILRSSMDGFFVLGPDYRFREVNDAFARMTGYSAAELLRMTILALETQDPSSADVNAAYARTGLHQFPTAHRHKDGHIVYLEISVLVLRDVDDGKIVVGFARDVTERRRAEQEQRRQTRQTRMILNSAGEGICAVNREGDATLINPAAARLLGREPGALIGRSLHEALYGTPGNGACRRRDCAVCVALADPKRSVKAEDEFVRADGTRLHVEFSSTSIAEDGRNSGAVIVFNDISERKRAEDDRRRLEGQIHQAQKLESLGLLAGGIAHDFNNILVGILGNACLAVEELPEDSPARARVQRIVNAGQRASKIIHQILAYAGRATPDAAPVDLNELLGEIVAFMQASVPKQAKLALECQPGLPPIAADSGQVEQMVSNLLLNALEALGERPGQVTVSTRSAVLSAEQIAREFAGQELLPGRYSCLEVRDTGRGMSPETLGRIFDPFFSRKAPGRGLGLAAIRGSVRAHAGGISVTSELGRGTTFLIVLPVAQQAVAPSDAAAPRGQTRCCATLLVVDDEEDIREVVQAVLENRGMRVLTASDGPCGLEAFRAHADEIDAVLLDMTMPGMDGLSVMREIQAIRPDARILLSSGYAENDIIARVGGRGLAGFVHKPYTADGLVASISEALQGPRATGKERLAALSASE